MSTVTKLNIKCLEYLREIALKKCRREDADDMCTRSWYYDILSDAFGNNNKSFWKWLGEDENLLTMRETVDVFKYLSSYFDAVVVEGDTNRFFDPERAYKYFDGQEGSDMKFEKLSEFVSMYGRAYCHFEKKSCMECITDVSKEFKKDGGKSVEIDIFKKQLENMMVADPKFDEWVKGGTFMIGENDSGSLAQACVMEGITFENVEYVFGNVPSTHTA